MLTLIEVALLADKNFSFIKDYRNWILLLTTLIVGVLYSYFLDRHDEKNRTVIFSQLKEVNEQLLIQKADFEAAHSKKYEYFSNVTQHNQCFIENLKGLKSSLDQGFANLDESQKIQLQTLVELDKSFSRELDGQTTCLKDSLSDALKAFEMIENVLSTQEKIAERQKVAQEDLINHLKNIGTLQDSFHDFRQSVHGTLEQGITTLGLHLDQINKQILQFKNNFSSIAKSNVNNISKLHKWYSSNVYECQKNILRLLEKMHEHLIVKDNAFVTINDIFPYWSEQVLQQLSAINHDLLKSTDIISKNISCEIDVLSKSMSDSDKKKIDAVTSHMENMDSDFMSRMKIMEMFLTEIKFVKEYIYKAADQMSESISENTEVMKALNNETADVMDRKIDDLTTIITGEIRALAKPLADISLPVAEKLENGFREVIFFRDMVNNNINLVNDYLQKLQPVPDGIFSAVGQFEKIDQTLNEIHNSLIENADHMRKRVSEAHAEFTAFHDTLIENKSNVKDITGEIVKFREHDFEKLQDQIRGIVEVSKKIESFQSGLSSDLSMAKFKEEFNKILKVLAFCAKDGKTLTTKLVSNIEKQLINLNDLLKSDKESVFTTIKKIETHFSELSLKDFFGEIDSAGAISIAFKEEFKQFDEIVQSHNEELKKIHDGLDKLLYDILEDH
jgi:hypothetical protein